MRKAELKKSEYWLAKGGFDHLRLDINLNLFLEKVKREQKPLFNFNDIDWFDATLTSNDKYHLQSSYSLIHLIVLEDGSYKLSFELKDKNSPVKTVCIYFECSLIITSIEVEYDEIFNDQAKLKELMVKLI